MSLAVKREAPKTSLGALELASGHVPARLPPPGSRAGAHRKVNHSRHPTRLRFMTMFAQLFSADRLDMTRKPSLNAVNAEFIVLRDQQLANFMRGICHIPVR